MSRNKEKPLVLAYFFPHDSTDPNRLKRARRGGRESIETDFQMALRDDQFFAEPSSYCLGDPKTTEWNDSDLTTIETQLELAKAFSVDGFIVDTYVGSQNGFEINELGVALDNIANLSVKTGMYFSSMFCLNLSRAIMPFKSNLVEKGRWFDLNRETAELIVDRAAELWQNCQYFHVDGKPLLSLYGLLNSPGMDSDSKQKFVSMIRNYSLKKYRTDLHLVGIGQSSKDMINLIRFGVDTASQYAGLPDFSVLKKPVDGDTSKNREVKPVQDYEEQLRRNIAEWQILSDIGLDFVPSALIGWNASCRGVQVETFEEVDHIAPYAPIITGNTPAIFNKGLQAVKRYLGENPSATPFYPVFAWNEIGESSTLLPKVGPDSRADYSYLEVIKAFQGSM